MARLDLYIDTYARSLVAGPSNPSPFTLPPFVQGDTVSLRIYLLERNTTYPLSNPYSIISNASLSLKVALGPKTGTAGSTLYTQQFTWTQDANFQYFYADFPLNTTAIGTLIGSAESAYAWFEVEYTQNGFPTTVFQQNVIVNAEVIETGSLVTPPGETAVSLEYINATFLKKTNEGFIMTNPNTGGRVFVYLHNDGTVHFDPIT
jgi:hypothetical protein